eukprot:521206-Rhodomonas_salina.3
MTTLASRAAFDQGGVRSVGGGADDSRVPPLRTVEALCQGCLAGLLQFEFPLWTENQCLISAVVVMLPDSGCSCAPEQPSAHLHMA